MELKISKIQWKKVLAFILTLCMTITMVQIPVNAEETAEPVNTPKHFNVEGLEYYEETATFFDAAVDRDAIGVQPVEENKTYTVDPTTGYYDAKWFSFTPEKDGIYAFRGENLEGDSKRVDSYGCLLEKNGESYDYIKDDDDSAQNLHFSVRAKLEAGKTYYLCAGFYSASGEETREYNISVSGISGQLISSSQPANYVTGSKDGWFYYTAEESGYHILKFSWNVKSGTYLDEWDYDIKDEYNDSVSYSTADSGENYRSIIFYCKKGETYNIDVGYFSFVNDDEAVESDINVKLEISKKEMDGTITYAQPVNYMTDGVSRIYKFTAQHDGAHVFKAAWNRTDVYMDGWNDSVDDADGSYVEMKHIATEKNAFYESFDCEAGKTYYIIMHDIYLCTDDTYEERVYNENATLSIAYYGGKTDIDTIKQNEKNNANKNNANNTKPDNTVTVAPASIKVSSIKIAALSNKIAAGKKVKLAATIAPENASNKAVKWTTSNKKVAKVSQSGVVTVNKKAAGKSVVITAIAADGSGTRATYKIKVMKDAVKRLTVTGKKVVKAGKKIKLKAKVAAGKKANKKLVWTSSNKKFATVNQKGVVKTTKAGKGKKVKITARTTDGSNKKKVFVIRIK